MQKQYYPALDETLYREVLPNGLRVFVNKRPGFTKKLCYFAVDFGSVHREFTFEGRHYELPGGVAHYLEHKMFELPDRDVTAQFGSLGANVNAFTSYDMTAYYFSCTENFEKALHLLLEFVSTPYFPAESVAREQSIIAQEIGMCADEPADRCGENLMQALYHQHPIRIPVLGTVASIAQITPELLELCHRAFYTPENMVLCVVGDVDEDQVCAIARQVLGDEKRPMAQKADFPPEEMVCKEAFTAENMEVAMPLFSMAIKATCPEKGEAAIRREYVGDLAAEALFGESSELYTRLYEQGLIDTSFSGGFDTVDGCAMLTCGGDSRDPQAVCRAIFDQAAVLAREGISQEDFLRMKRSALGRKLRSLDSFDATCFRICAYEMSGYDYFSFPQLYEKLCREEVREFISQVVRQEACSLSVIYPFKEET